MGVNIEGPVSALVTDAMKVQCDKCNGVKFSISSTFDNINNVASAVESALGLTNVGVEDIQGTVLLCLQCGVQQIGHVSIFDIAAGAAAAAITMTNLVSTSANNLAGWYMVYLDAAGTDTGKYSVIASNTAADPTVITVTVATNNTEVGYYWITNWLPLGFTATT